MRCFICAAAAEERIAQCVKAQLKTITSGVMKDDPSCDLCTTMTKLNCFIHVASISDIFFFFVLLRIPKSSSHSQFSCVLNEFTHLTLDATLCSLVPILCHCRNLVKALLSDTDLQFGCLIFHSEDSFCSPCSGFLPLWITVHWHDSPHHPSVRGRAQFRVVLHLLQLKL